MSACIWVSRIVGLSIMPSNTQPVIKMSSKKTQTKQQSATLYFTKAIDYLHYYRIFSIIHIFRFMGAMKNYNATSNKRRVCKTKLASFFFNIVGVPKWLSYALTARVKTSTMQSQNCLIESGQVYRLISCQLSIVYYLTIKGEKNITKITKIIHFQSIMISHRPLFRLNDDSMSDFKMSPFSSRAFQISIISVPNVI